MNTLTDLGGILKRVHSQLFDVPMGVDGEWVRRVAKELLDARQIVNELEEKRCEHENGCCCFDQGGGDGVKKKRRTKT